MTIFLHFIFQTAYFRYANYAHNKSTCRGGTLAAWLRTDRCGGCYRMMMMMMMIALEVAYTL